MTNRFRVIEGGLSETKTAAGRADRRLPSNAAWQAMTTPEAADSAFTNTDYLLPTASHPTNGHNLGFALAWSRGEESETDSLHGAVRSAPPHAVSRRDRGQFTQLRETEPGAEGLIEARYADEVAAALRRRLAASPRRPTLHPAGCTAAEPLARQPLATIPANSVIDVRPASSLETEQVSEKPHGGDAAEAGMAGVVGRLFARRRQTGLKLVRRNDEAVAGAPRNAGDVRVVTWGQAYLASERV